MPDLNQTNQPITNNPQPNNDKGAYPEPPLIITTPTKSKISKKQLIIGGIVALIIFASVPLGLLLVQNRQDIRQKAAGPGCLNDHPAGASWPDCNGCDEGVTTCNSDGNYSFQSVKNPSSNCGTGCQDSETEPEKCDNGRQIGDTWPECHGCDEGVVLCQGGSNYGWNSVKNPSTDCPGCSGCSSTQYKKDGVCVDKMRDDGDGMGGCCSDKYGCPGLVACNIPNGSCLSGTSCQPDASGLVTCSADSTGISVTNNSGQTVSGTYFTGTCEGNYSCLCGGSPTSITVAAHSTESRSFDMGNLCGSWQTDVDITIGGDCHAAAAECNRCDSTPPTTPTTYDCRCSTVSLYRDGARIEPDQVKYGDTIDIEGFGWIDAAESEDTIDFMKMTIKKDGIAVFDKGYDPVRVSVLDQGTKRFYKASEYGYVVNQAGTYTVEFTVHTPKKGWLGK